MASHAGNPQSASNSLLRSSISFFHIVFMVTAAAAPLVVVSAYIPISLAGGAGMSVALTYAATTFILLIFTVGFAQMAKRITSAGAFYTFATQGLGRPVGLAVGFTVMAAYSMISPAIAGGFGFYTTKLLSAYFGLDIAWYWCSIASLALMFMISFYRITYGASILSFLLAVEVLVILIVCLATVGSGGASGQMPEAFSLSQWSTAPAVGIGFFLAFWSWIGFETTAIYGEETMDPKRAVPRATYIAVLTLGLFYTFTAYAGIVGFGAEAPGKAGTLIDQYYFELADIHTIHTVRVIMDFLVITSFFACSFAFHNNATRYLFSLGRDGILPKSLGSTHSEQKSPYIAAAVQATIAIVTVALFALAGADPLLHLGTWLPIFCTLAVIVVQFIVSLAVIGYFNRIGRSGPLDWWKTILAPILGAIAQAVVVWLLLENITFLAGSEIMVVKLIPLYVAIIALAGFGYALWLRNSDRSRYDMIGQLHDEEMMDAFVDEMYVADGRSPN
ncbi:APC family permease [Agrobacterium rhizogenes]|uniref:APC family permease n=1 Tax=Agrobacterium sp. ST15.13.015 TaxID=3017319 RepID=UPI0022C3ABBD|nr:APC family permease [Agrobacterium sp. ST15.13.015]MCZ7497374.1 APC family permease [Rhizobium rhizogenes]MCZ7501867.1 APC family permease [Rhizobium rhizogenes]